MFWYGLGIGGFAWPLFWWMRDQGWDVGSIILVLAIIMVLVAHGGCVQATKGD